VTLKNKGQQQRSGTGTIFMLLPEWSEQGGLPAVDVDGLGA